jgi:predicted transcriptional regulator
MRKPSKKPLADHAGEDTVWISFRIDAEVARVLDLAAVRQDRSRSAVIRRLIVEHHSELIEKSA